MAGRVAGGKDGDVNDQERAVLTVVVGNQAVMMAALAALTADLLDNLDGDVSTEGFDKLLDALTWRAELSFGLRDAMQGAEDAAD